MAAAPLAVLVGMIVPQPGAQDTPFCVRLQLTPLLVPSFFTVAVNCCVPFRATLAEPGETDTEIWGRVSPAVAEALVFVTDVATTDTGDPKKKYPALLGGVKWAGAVYVVCAPLVVLAGEKVPHPLQGRTTEGGSPRGWHFPEKAPSQKSFANTCQVTPPLFGSFVTVAVNCCVPPAGTVAEPGAIETVIPGGTEAGTVMVAEAVLVPSVTDVAVSVTVKLLVGALAGAV